MLDNQRQESDRKNNKEEFGITSIEVPPKDNWQKRVENIIYNIYIQEKTIESPKPTFANAKIKE
jgi:hypothetical protein